MAQQVFGALATLTALFVFVPQALAVWRRRNDLAQLQAISLGTQGLLLISSVCFCVYAALTGAWWSGAPGLMNIPLAVFIVVTVVRARRTEPAAR